MALNASTRTLTGALANGKTIEYATIEDLTIVAGGFTSWSLDTDGRLRVDGTTAGETITATDSSATIGSLLTVNFTGINALGVSGHEGADTFNVTPGAIPIHIDGGDPIGVPPEATDFDKIVMVSSSASVEHNPGPENDEGSLIDGTNAPVSFDHIEQTALVGDAAALGGEVTLTLGDAANEIGLNATGDQELTITSDSLRYVYNAPDGSIFNIDGGGADDTFTFDFSGSSFVQDFNIDGGDGVDNLIVQGTDLVNAAEIDIHADGTASLSINPTITLSGIGFNLGGVTFVNMSDFIVNGTPLSETLTMEDAGGGFTSIRSSFGPFMKFTHGTAKKLTINAGLGDDTINVNQPASSFPVKLILNGEDGQDDFKKGGVDTINVSGNISVRDSVTASAEYIDVSGRIDTSPAGANGPIQLDGATVAVKDLTTAGAGVVVNSTGLIQVDGSILTGGGPVTIEAEGDVDFGSSAAIDVQSGSPTVKIQAGQGGGALTKLNGPLVANGDVDYQRFTISPDNRRAVYLADQDVDNIEELYSVPLTGGVPVKLSQAGMKVDAFAISPDGQRVVYRADQNANDVLELYSIPITGGTSVRINGALRILNGDVYGFVISGDSKHVVYTVSDTSIVASTNGEMFSVPITGATAASPVVKLSDGYVQNFSVSANNQVVFVRLQNGVSELFAMPIRGGTAVKINGSLVAGGNVGSSFSTSADGQYVVYTADQDADEVVELYRVPIGGGSVVKLNGVLTANGDVDWSWLWSEPTIDSDSKYVVYEADQDTDGVNELYSVPISGGSTTKISGTLVTGGNVQAHEISPDSKQVVYLADEDINGTRELYTVPITGGTPTRINVTLFYVAPWPPNYAISPDSRQVVYVANQDTKSILELYSVPITGGSSAKVSDPHIVAGGAVLGFSVSTDNQRVVYVADQETVDLNELYATVLPGEITMADGSVVNARGGTVDMDAGRDIALSDVRATGTVNVNSTAGGIVDNTTTESFNIVAASAELQASNGIGNDDDLNTIVSRLAFHNSDSGDVNIRNTDGLTIGTVDGLTSSTNGNGSVSVVASSPVVFAHHVSATNISANATGNASVSTDDITVNGGVTVAATSNLNLLAGDDIEVGVNATVTANQLTLASGQDTDSAGSMTLFGDVVGTGGSSQIVLDAREQATQPSGKITGDQLHLLGRSFQLNSVQNDVDGISGSVDGQIQYRDADDLSISNSLSTTNDDITLTTGGLLTIAGTVNVGTATLTVNSTGGAMQNSGDDITAHSVLLSGTGNFTLTSSANYTNTLAGSVSGGSLSWTDEDDLTIGLVAGTAGVTAASGVAIVAPEIRLGAKIQTDGGNVTLNGVTSSGADGKIIVATTHAVIDTDQNNGTAGSVELINAVVSADGKGRALTIDTTTTAAAGNVNLPSFAASSGFSLNELNVNAAGGTADGQIDFDGGVALASNGSSDLASLVISGDVRLDTDTVLSTSDSSTSAGSMNLGGANFSAIGTGIDLTLDARATGLFGAAGNGGNIDLGSFSVRAGQNEVNGLSIWTTPSGLTSLVGTTTINHNIAVDGDLTIAGTVELPQTTTTLSTSSSVGSAGDIDLRNTVIKTFLLATSNFNLNAAHAGGLASNNHGGDVLLGSTAGLNDVTIDVTSNGNGGRGGSVIAGGSLQMNKLHVTGSAGDATTSSTVTFQGAVTVGAGGLTIDPPDEVLLKGNVTSSGPVSIEANDTIRLEANIRTDGGDVLLNGDVILANKLTIETETDNSGNAGEVRFQGGQVYADSLSRDLTLDTRAPGIGGDVTLLSPLTGGPTANTVNGTVPLNDLVIDATGGTDGIIKLGEDIQLTNNGPSSASTLRIAGEVRLSDHVTLNLSDANASGGSIDLTGATLSSDGATTYNLTLDTHHFGAQANANGGAVQLGEFVDPISLDPVGQLTIDATTNSSAGGVGGSVTTNGAITLGDRLKLSASPGSTSTPSSVKFDHDIIVQGPGGVLVDPPDVVSLEQGNSILSAGPVVLQANQQIDINGLINAAFMAAKAQHVSLTAPTIELSNDITTDGGPVIVNGPLVIADNNVRIETEVGDNDTAGDVIFQNGGLSAKTAGLDLTIDASPLQPGNKNPNPNLSGGNVRLEQVAELPGGRFLKSLTVDANGTVGTAIDGVIQALGSIRVDGHGTGAASLTLRGDVLIDSSVEWVTRGDSDSTSGVNDSGGLIDLSDARVFANGKDKDLVLDSRFVGQAAGKSGGDIQLGEFVAPAHWDSVRDVTVRSINDTIHTGTDGTITVIGDVRLDRNLKLVGPATLETATIDVGGKQSYESPVNLAQPVLIIANELLLKSTLDLATHAASVNVGMIGEAQDEIRGTGDLSVTGAGTLILSASNAYVGNTTVNSGQLHVNGSIAAGGAVIVNGGSLGGTGTVHSPVTMNATGGSVSPGTSPGTLTVDESVTFDPAGKFAVELDGAGDQMKTTGQNRVVRLGDAQGNDTSLDISFAAMPQPGTTFTLIDNVDPSSAVQGVFKNAPNNIVAVGTFRGQIDYAGGDGNDVVLEVLARIPVTTVGLVGSTLNLGGGSTPSATGGSTVTLAMNSDTGALMLSDENSFFNVGNLAGSTGDMTGTATIPIAGIEQLVIQGRAVVDDTLTLDVTGGFIGVPILYNGGAAGFDSLEIVGTPTTSVETTTYRPGPNNDDGRVEYRGADDSLLMQIDFTGLEPVIDTTPSTTLVIAGTPGVNAINLSQSRPGFGLATVDTFESLEFANKTDVTINAGAGRDAIGISTFSAGFSGVLTVNGGEPAEGDTLIVSGTTGDDALTYQPSATASDTGTITLGSRTLEFSAIEDLSVNSLRGDDSLTAKAALGTQADSDSWRIANPAGGLLFAYADTQQLGATLRAYVGGSVVGTDSGDGPGASPALAGLPVSVGITDLDLEQTAPAVLVQQYDLLGTIVDASKSSGETANNDSPLSASPIASSAEYVLGNFSAASDVDVFSFTATGDRVSVIVDNDPERDSRLTHSRVELLDFDPVTETVTVLASNDNAGDANAVGKVSVVSGRTYYVRLSKAGEGTPPDPNAAYRFAVVQTDSNRAVVEAQLLNTISQPLGPPPMMGRGSLLPPADDVVTIDPVGNDRLQFNQSTPLTLVGIENVTIDAGGGGDRVVVNASQDRDFVLIDSTSVTVNGQKIGLLNDRALDVNLRDGDDLVNISSLAGKEITVGGGNPGSSDTLDLTSSSDRVDLDLSGSIVDDEALAAVSFVGIEHVSVDAKQLSVTSANQAPGNEVVYTHVSGSPSRGAIHQTGDNVVYDVAFQQLTIQDTGRFANSVLRVQGTAHDNRILVRPGLDDTGLAFEPNALTFAIDELAARDTLKAVRFAAYTVESGFGNDSIVVEYAHGIPAPIAVDGGDPVGIPLPGVPHDTLTVVGGGQFYPGPRQAPTPAVYFDEGSFSAPGKPSISYDHIEELTQSGLFDINPARETSEAGVTDGVVLSAVLPLRADVTVPVSSSDVSEGTVSVNSVVLTPSNPTATVTVTGVDDNLLDGDVFYTVDLGPTSSTDPSYNAAAPLSPVIVNRDDEIESLIVTPTSGLETTESGGTATFTVALAVPIGDPSTSAWVRVTSSDLTEGTVSPSYFEFTSATGPNPQTVTVTGVADGWSDGDQQYSVRLIGGGTGLLSSWQPGLLNTPVSRVIHVTNRDVPQPDDDTDGVSNATEDAGPNDGDGNRNGTPDSQEANVVSLPKFRADGFVTLASSGNTTLQNVQSVAIPSSEDAPEGILFPIGFFEYQVGLPNPGEATTVTIYMPTDAGPVTRYYMYGPEPQDPTTAQDETQPHWYEFRYDGTTGAEFKDDNRDGVADRVLLHFVDGLRGDSDLAANGVIVDPGAPGVPETSTGEVGQNDFRISFFTQTGLAPRTFDPDITYNPKRDEYFVVYHSYRIGHGTGSDMEVFGQRIDARTGALIGSRIQITDRGNGSDSRQAGFASVTYNAANDEYYVVFMANHANSVPGWDLPESEVHGQRIRAADGALIGSETRLSDMGPDGNTGFDARIPHVAYSATSNVYFVVWHGDDTTNDEYEVFGQFVDAATGVEIAGDQRVSFMGLDGDAAFDGRGARVAWNAKEDQFLVVWAGSDNTGSLTASMEQVYGRAVDASQRSFLGGQFMISDPGAGINPRANKSISPNVAYNPNDNQFLVVWFGHDNVGNTQIDAQRLDGATYAQVGANDFRVTDVNGHISLWPPYLPGIVYDPNNHEYLVVWDASDVQTNSSVVLDEYEIYGQRIDAVSGADVGANDFRISDMNSERVTGEFAASSCVAYAHRSGEYLVVWSGVEEPFRHPRDHEVYGQRLRFQDRFRFHYAAADGNDDLTLKLDETQTFLQLVDTASGNVLRSQTLASLTEVLIEGGGGNDKLRVDIRTNALGLTPVLTVQGGITFDGGSGFDEVFILGDASDMTAFYHAGLHEGAGRVVHLADRAQQIDVENLERINDQAPGKLYVNGTPDANQIDVAGIIQIDNFPSYIISRKSTVVVDGGAGDDVTEVSSRNPAVTGTLKITDSDPVSADTLLVSGTTDPDTFQYASDPTERTSGTFRSGPLTIAFAGMSNIIVDGLTGDDALTATDNAGTSVRHYQTAAPGTAGAKVYAAAFSTESTSGTDTTLNAFRSDGTTPIGTHGDDDSGPLNAAVLAGLPVPEGDTVVLFQVGSGDGEPVSSFMLVGVFGPGDFEAETEPNDTTGDVIAVNINQGYRVTGQVAAGLGNIDLVAVNINQGYSLAAVVNNNDPTGNGELTQTQLRILGSDGETVVATGGNQPAAAANAVATGPLAAGTYYVELTNGSLNGEGDYELVIFAVDDAQAQQADPSNSALNPTPLAPGEHGTGAIDKLGRNDEVELTPHGNNEARLRFNDSTPLELLSLENVTIDPQGGVDTLDIFGTPNSDIAALDGSTVTVNNQVFSHANTEIFGLFGQSGDDLVAVQSALAGAVTFDGGDGTDQLGFAAHGGSAVQVALPGSISDGRSIETIAVEGFVIVGMSENVTLAGTPTPTATVGVTPTATNRVHIVAGQFSYDVLTTGDVTIDGTAPSTGSQLPLARLDVRGSALADTVTVSDTEVNIGGGLKPIKLNAVPSVRVFGDEGLDTFELSPSGNTRFSIDGGAPSGVGDELTVRAFNSIVHPGPETDEGAVEAPGMQIVSFDRVEKVTTAPVVSVQGGTLAQAKSDPNPPSSNVPSGIAFPLGFFEFTVQVPNPGDAAVVTVQVPSGVTIPMALASYYKYGREPNYQTPHWYHFLYDGTTGAEFKDDDNDGKADRILLHFVDGMRGDSDNISAQITDPGGPVIPDLPDPGGTADLVITNIDAPDPVASDGNVTYTLTVTNNGPDPASGVTLVDSLPASASFVSSQADGACSYDDGTHVVTCQLGDLGVEADATVTIVVQAAQLGRMTNSASGTAAQSDPNPANNLATASTLVLPEVALSEGESSVFRDGDDVVVRRATGEEVLRVGVADSLGVILHGTDTANQVDIASLGTGRIVVDQLNDEDGVTLAAGGRFVRGEFIDGVFYNIVDLNGTEVLLTGPHPWQNPANPLDVNGDGDGTPLDILAMIGGLNRGEGGPLPTSPTPGAAPTDSHVDVNGDDVFSALDVLMGIGFLSRQSAGGGEGEANRRILADPSDVPFIPSSQEQLPAGNDSAQTDSVAETAMSPAWSRDAFFTAIEERDSRVVADHHVQAYEEPNRAEDLTIMAIDDILDDLLLRP